MSVKGANKSQILTKELTFLYRIAQTVYSLEIEDLLKEIVAIATEVTHGDSCLVYIVDRKHKELVLRASKNPRQKLLRKIKLKLGEGITGWVAQERQPVIISTGAAKDSRFRFFPNLPEDFFKAFLSVPIISKRGVVGVINIQHKEKHLHTPMEVNLLVAMGKLLGGAVDNALLVEETLLLKETLELRKLIEKAKGLLMKNSGLSEEEAYRKLQKESMKTGKSMRELAEAIVIAANMHF